MAGADQVVCPFFGVVFERLNSLIYNVQIKKLGPLVKEELRKLFKTFLKIKEVIDDAEEQQFNEKAVRVRFWLQELNEAAYEADDVFDKFEYEALQQAEGASTSNNKRKKQMKPRKIEKLIQIFDELAQECSELDLQKQKEKSMLVSLDRITDPLLTEPKVYGRDEAREVLVKQLLGPAYLTLQKFRTLRSYKHPTANQSRVLNSTSSSSNGGDNISVFPIQGMGGLGKTTLAKMVYNDERVQKHFDFISWVCISADFDTKRVMKEILASLPRHTNATDKLELQKHFHEESQDKRFLVVLDDVWNVTQDEWNEMKSFFRAGAQGSSIVVTTRLSTAACITGTVLPNCISKLSDKECLELFKQYAFGLGNEERPSLVKIGKEIVKKCEGLPLAVKALGGLLRFKNDENEWLSIKDSAIWDFENAILPALRLSYYHLSFPLKQCFVYCSIFPKDLKIEKEQLIQLWMANGLVQSRAEMDLEDVGNAIFNELLSRSFFQDIEKDEDGHVISCQMHDLMHDLATYIAGDECFVKDVESSRSPTEGTRHASIHFDIELMQRSSPCLRSFIQFSDNDGENGMTLKSEFVFSDFILLRALDLNSCGIDVVQDCIGEMKHLRYLNLSYNNFTSLPKSICLLRNMQTLNLSQCCRLSSLPEHIENMRCLIHLDIEGCESLTSMPVGIGQLTHLRTLHTFIVDKENGSGVDGLQGLNNLRGSLGIEGLHQVETLTEAKEANLMGKKNLHSLGLCWALGLDSDSDSDSDSYSHSDLDSDRDSESREQQHQNVIEGLQSHSNLRKLFVEGYQGVTLSPSWLTKASLLPNLVQISLFYCKCEHLGSLRKLPRLKVLELQYMNSLKFIEEEVVDDASSAAGGGFSSLEQLILWWMRNLEGWSSSSSSPQASTTTVFPCLKNVKLCDCPKLKRGVPLAWSPIQHVEIEGSCNGMVLGSLRDLPSLSSGFVELEYFPSGTLTNLPTLHNLEIKDCLSLKAFPVDLNSLTTLTKLEIWRCPNLVSLAEEREGGFKNLSSLKTIHINDCRALKRLPELNKASLVSLRISYCPEMEFSKEDFEHLVVLEELRLYGLPKLTCFPEGIKHSAATFRSLLFMPHSTYGSKYGTPVDLLDWIGTTLTSLEYLAIDAPKNWNVLPQWMQHLTALKELKIYGCNDELIEQWWKWNRGEQREDNRFNLISHVPIVYLSHRFFYLSRWAS